MSQDTAIRFFYLNPLVSLSSWHYVQCHPYSFPHWCLRVNCFPVCPLQLLTLMTHKICCVCDVQTSMRCPYRESLVRRLLSIRKRVDFLKNKKFRLFPCVAPSAACTILLGLTIWLFLFYWVYQGSRGTCPQCVVQTLVSLAPSSCLEVPSLWSQPRWNQSLTLTNPHEAVFY